jgi:hypothetical protein
MHCWLDYNPWTFLSHFCHLIYGLLPKILTWFIDNFFVWTCFKLGLAIPCACLNVV